MSLQIRLNGQVVDLTPATSVGLERVNPYLVYEDILSSKATIPNLPATQRNRRIMDFPELLQSDTVGMRYHSQKYYNGQLLQEGVAILTEASETFALTVVEPLGELFSELQKITLPAVSFGAVALPSPLQPVLQTFGRNVLAFPSIQNPDFYGSNGTALGYTSGLVNRYEGGSYTTEPVVPMIFLKELLLRIQELTGVTISGQFLEHPELSQLLLYNTRALDGRFMVELQQHLPDITIPVLLLELRKMFNLAMKVDTVERTIRLDFMDNYQRKAATRDWSDKAVKGHKKKPETARRLQLGSEPNGGDGLAKDKPEILADYVTPELASETGISPLKTKFSTLLTDATTGLATTKQPGVTDRGGQLANTFGPVLLFWNGIQNGKPTATAKRNGYSLYWTGADGLAAQFWALTEQVRKSQFYVERQVALDEVDLARLDWSEKVHINGVDYWVASITLSLPIKQPATVLLLRC